MAEEKKLKELIVVDRTLEAEIIKSKLESFNISVHLKFDSTRHLFGITMNGLGKVQLLVPEDQWEEARQLLEQ